MTPSRRHLIAWARALATLSAAAGLLVLLVPAFTSWTACHAHTLGCFEKRTSLLDGSPWHPLALVWLLWILVSAPGLWFRRRARVLSILTCVHAALLVVAGAILTAAFLGAAHLRPLMLSATIVGTLAAVSAALLDLRRSRTDPSTGPPADAR